MNDNKYTVTKLIAELRKFHPDTEVWFSSDEEGNCFHSKGIIAMTDIAEEGESKEVCVVYPLSTSEDIY